MKKKHIVVCIIILLSVTMLSVLGFYVDSVRKNKDDETNVDSKIAEFGDSVDTAQTVQILNEANDLPEQSQLMGKSIDHLSRIDETGKFTEHTLGKQEEVKPVIVEEQKSYPHFFVANIMDRRLLEHYVYDIVVDNDKSYTVTMTTIPDSDEEVPDYTDDKFKHETNEDILGDAEFSLLKGLLQAYEKENLCHDKDGEAEYNMDLTVNGSNTIEETTIWIADRLLGKEVEHLDPEHGIVKTVMGFDEIRDYIEKNQYAVIKEQLTEKIEEKKEEQAEDEEIILTYDTTEEGQ